MHLQYDSSLCRERLLLGSTSAPAQDGLQAMNMGMAVPSCMATVPHKPAHLHHGGDEGKGHEAHAAQLLGDVALAQWLQQGGVAAQQAEGQGADRVEDIVENLVAAAEFGVLRGRQWRPARRRAAWRVPCIKGGGLHQGRFTKKVKCLSASQPPPHLLRYVGHAAAGLDCCSHQRPHPLQLLFCGARQHCLGQRRLLIGHTQQI